MAQYEEHNKLDYRFGGDTIDDFAIKYMAEITRIFRFLNDLKENRINSIEYTEPSAGQFKVEDEKLYIRDGSNTKWVLLGNIDENFGFKPAGASFLNSEDIGTGAGQIPVLNENGILDVSISGNAGKIAGIRNEVNNIQDGEVLTYRAATNSWRNEPKGVIGAGKSLNLYDGEELLCAYSGDEPQNFDMRFTENQNKIDAAVEEVKEAVDKKINTHNDDPNAHANRFRSPLMKWTSGTSYAVNDIIVNDNKIWMCIEDNTDVEFDKSKWVNIGGGGGYFLGEIRWLSAEDAEAFEGIFKADGAEVSRTMYPDLNRLYASHGYPWGDGDGSTTFNLPNLMGKFPEGAEQAGGYHEAGLPNIEGMSSARTKDTANFNVSGAFYQGTNNVVGHTYSKANDSYLPELFDASRSNSIYGNSTTVQPPSALLLPYVVVFTDATADSALVDMTQVNQDLAGKANRDLSNLTEAGQEKLGYGDNDFTIIYPNGGTKENPANIAVNSRYVMDNPFHGYYVVCKTEILHNEEWAEVGIYSYYSTGATSYGAYTRQLEDNLVLQTGTNGILASSFVQFNPFGVTEFDTTAKKCRVKVWKIGKAV